jgi:hypothetical protein
MWFLYMILTSMIALIIFTHTASSYCPFTINYVNSIQLPTCFLILPVYHKLCSLLHKHLLMLNYHVLLIHEDSHMCWMIFCTRSTRSTLRSSERRSSNSGILWAATSGLNKESNVTCIMPFASASLLAIEGNEAVIKHYRGKDAVIK